LIKYLFILKQPIHVCDYATIKKLIERGNANKTIAETKMNATSSRSHTIVELKFKQLFKNKAGSLMQRSSTISLVDLAGRLVIYLKLD
jgi:kinesin family member 13